jgi:hypothetical protein
MQASGAAAQQQAANNNIAYQNAVNRNNAIAAQNEANFQAQVARNNAIIAQQNATAIGERAEAAVEDKKFARRLVVGAARARQAALGFLVDDTPDSTNVGGIANLWAAGELDIWRIRDKGEAAARMARIQGINFREQELLFETKADSALSRVVQNQGGSPQLAAAGAFFSGATRTAALFV